MSLPELAKLSPRELDNTIPTRERGIVECNTPPRSQPEWRDESLLPRSVFGWVPFWWSRVLFGGKPARPETWTWRPFLIVLLFSGALLYPCLSFYLFEPDEGRYAQIPREMLERGEWIVPTLQNEPYLDKPPLFYWLVMLSYKIFGYHDWTARLVPALAVQATILLCYFFARRYFGARAAFCGALALTLMPGLVGMGRLLVLDGLLALWVTCSLLAAYLAVETSGLHRGWWLLAALACGLGVLTKGPIAVILLVPPLWLYRMLTQNRAAIGWRGWFWFAAVVLAVNAPWYVAATVTAPNFAWHFLWEHNVLRFFEPFDHVRPIWFYGPILIAGLFPLVLLSWPFLKFLFSARSEDADKRHPALGYLLLAACWCVLFFSLSGCKLPTYILPAFPPLAMAFGVFLAHSTWGHSRAVRLGAIGCGMLFLLVHWLVIPAVAWARSPMNQPERFTTMLLDRSIAVVCFPRNTDSIAFYVGRDDFQTYRSKDYPLAIAELAKHERAVVLFGHRHSLDLLSSKLPTSLRVVDNADMGLCDVAVIEKTPNQR
ncbi:MAG: glycosyltransferase family 39 protein [Gemmataceae bacterium]|nr:glycosyltransferase family 39 protein [Gemmataceae bacterium]MCI0743670.1 glycosyltransferase family 39 protein [Gemmataceae bacterium]